MPLGCTHGNVVAGRFAKSLILSAALLAAAAPLPLAQSFAQENGAQPTWGEAAPLPAARSEVAVAQLAGQIYVVGGTGPDGEATRYNTSYDPKNNAWRERAPLPVAMHHIGLATLGRKLYAIGGFTSNVHVNPQALALVYDPAKDRWTQIAPLPLPMGSVAVAAVGRRLHVFGGGTSRTYTQFQRPNSPTFTIGHGTVTTHYIYDPASDKWLPGPELPAPSRDHMGVAVLNGKIHLFGGRVDGGDTNLAKHDVYDPAKGTWASAAPLPEPRSSGAYTVFNSLIIYAGGECKPGKMPGSPNTFEVVNAYDSAHDSWSALPPLPHGRHAFGATAIGQTLYFAAGSPLCGGGGSAELSTLKFSAHR